MAVVLGVEKSLFVLKKISQVVQETTILSNISLAIQPGEFLAILGSSGSGKTTLLRLFNGLDSPSGGTISLHGKSIDAWNMNNLRKQVGMVFQEPVVCTGNVKDNLVLTKRWEKPPSVISDYDLLSTLEKVGLQAIELSTDARTLSVGEKQRLALARVLLNRPQVLLLDEPTSNLDPALTRRIIRRIADLHREMNLTIIMVSHNPDLAQVFASRIIFLHDGRINSAGTVDILNHPDSPELQAYLAEDH